MQVSILVQLEQVQQRMEVGAKKSSISATETIEVAILNIKSKFWKSKWAGHPVLSRPWPLTPRQICSASSHPLQKSQVFVIVFVICAFCHYIRSSSNWNVPITIITSTYWGHRMSRSPPPISWSSLPSSPSGGNRSSSPPHLEVTGRADHPFFAGLILLWDNLHSLRIL